MEGSPEGWEVHPEEARLADGWVPVILVSEDLTPLPLAERALPTIRLFSGLIGRGRLAGYRVAVLRELAILPRSHLPIRAIQDAIPWMDWGLSCAAR